MKVTSIFARNKNSHYPAVAIFLCGDQTSSVSVVMVLVVPAFVTVVREEELLLPLIMATRRSITIMPPATQTHGAVYHSLLCVVVVFTVVLELLPGLSWAQQIFIMISDKIVANNFKNFSLAALFITYKFNYTRGRSITKPIEYENVLSQ